MPAFACGEEVRSLACPQKNEVRLSPWQFRRLTRRGAAANRVLDHPEDRPILIAGEDFTLYLWLAAGGVAVAADLSTAGGSTTSLSRAPSLQKTAQLSIKSTRL